MYTQNYSRQTLLLQWFILQKSGNFLEKTDQKLTKKITIVQKQPLLLLYGRALLENVDDSLCKQKDGHCIAN